MTGFSRRRCSRFGMLVLSAFALALVATPSEALAGARHGSDVAAASSCNATLSNCTLLDFPDPSPLTTQETQANGINSNDSIVGFYRTTVDPAETYHGFLLVNGVFTTIDVDIPGVTATTTVAEGVGGSGRIVGEYRDSGGVHGFQLVGGTFTSITAFGGQASTSALGISSKGVVGYYVSQQPFGVHGFLLDGSILTEIVYPGATFTAAAGIDSKGRIVGTYVGADGHVHGFLRDGSGYSPINVPGATDTQVQGIASPGGIVGQYWDASGVHGFFTPDGITSFTKFDACGSTNTVANGISTNGFIVGACEDSAGKTHGFLWKR